MSDKPALLKDGFDAMWYDMQHRDIDLKSARQAFKNGASIIAAKVIVKGQEEAINFVSKGAVYIVHEVTPWALANMEVHPEWNNNHFHAILAGALAASVVVLNRRSIRTQVNAFRV